MEKDQEKNQVKIGFRTRIGNVVRYSENLINEEKFRTIHFSAIGGAIGSLVNVVEVLKTLHPGLHQVNKISSVSHQTIDSNNKEIYQERLSPKMDATLSFDKPNVTSGEGYQEPYQEDFRKKLEDKLNEKKERRNNNNNYSNNRGRGGNFSMSRGRGGNFSGPMRGGNRGMSRGSSRGRGFRGMSRGRGRGFGEMSRGRGFGGSSRGRGFGGMSRGRGGNRGGFRPRGNDTRGRGRGDLRGRMNRE